MANLRQEIVVDFPTLKSPRSPLIIWSASIKQNRYTHDMGKIVFRDWNLPDKIYIPGTPLAIKLINNGITKVIPGYINHIRKTQTTGKRFTELVFVGASFRMKQKTQKVYKNVTVSQVARQIAKKYRLAADITNHKRVFPQLAQHGESDWEFLTKCAKKAGYLFRVDGITLVFKPIDEDYTFLRNQAPTFTMADSAKMFGSTLYSFVPIIGEHTPFPESTKASKAYKGINPITKKIHSITNPKSKTKRKISKPAIFDSFDTDTVVPSFDIAKSHAEAFSEMNKFPYRGEAEVFGTPDIIPGSPVYFTGIGSEYNGYWIALSVEHIITTETPFFYKYTTNLEVGTDSLGPANTWNGEIVSPPINARTASPRVTRRVLKPRLNPVLKSILTSTTPETNIIFGQISNTALSFSKARNETISFWESEIPDVRGKQDRPSTRSAYTTARVRRRCCQI